jgi:GNAT superfamily N-acetyltransferase
VKVKVLTGSDLDNELDDVAQLRIAVFRDWPYLYDGDQAYERKYLQAYQTSKDALIVGAYDGDWLVGASTGAPLVDHAQEFGGAFSDMDLDISRFFYCAESVLLPRYRGQGVGKTFFDLREKHARDLGYSHICFCAVVRPDDHPLRPDAYQPLDGFWESRGYAPLPNVIATFEWKDVDKRVETRKPLQFWMRPLTR